MILVATRELHLPRALKNCLNIFNLIWLVLLFQTPAVAGEVRVAVAANFAGCLQKISQQFQETSGHEVIPIVGATGRHFAQISAGAPFDVFLAADQRHPALLVENGLAVASSSFIYAQGCLVLWVADSLDVPAPGIDDILNDPSCSKVAMANPRLAPYGEAALQTLSSLGLNADLDGRLVLGTSVGQTWQFAATGNTDAALVALSQMMNLAAGEFLIVPAELYDPINQQAVLLKRSSTNEAARSFMKFLESPAAELIIHSYGYNTVGQED